MPETVASIIQAARVILQDTVEPVRYTQQELARYVWDAVMETKRLRPDLFLPSVDDSSISYSTDLEELVPIPDPYIPPIVNYVVGRAELRDDKFSQDSRAIGLMTAFSAALTGLRSIRGR